MHAGQVQQLGGHERLVSAAQTILPATHPNSCVLDAQTPFVATPRLPGSSRLPGNLARQRHEAER